MLNKVLYWYLYFFVKRKKYQMSTMTLYLKSYCLESLLKKKQTQWENCWESLDSQRYWICLFKIGKLCFKYKKTFF